MEGMSGLAKKAFKKGDAKMDRKPGLTARADERLDKALAKSVKRKYPVVVKKEEPKKAAKKGK